MDDTHDALPSSYRAFGWWIATLQAIFFGAVVAVNADVVPEATKRIVAATIVPGSLAMLVVAPLWIMVGLVLIWMRRPAAALKRSLVVLIAVASILIGYICMAMTD